MATYLHFLRASTDLPIQTLNDEHGCEKSLRGKAVEDRRAPFGVMLWELRQKHMQEGPEHLYLKTGVRPADYQSICVVLRIIRGTIISEKVKAKCENLIPAGW